MLTRVNQKDQVSIIGQGTNYALLKNDKASIDLKARLQTSWRKVYRDLIKYDLSKTNKVPLPKFLKYLHRQNCFVSREELIKLYQKFGNAYQQSIDLDQFQNIFGNENNWIDYKHLSKDMGLHQSYLEFI